MPLSGECKTPGGKLVAIVCDIEQARLQSVQIHGDFFIHPEPEAAAILSNLKSALHHLLIEATLEEITELLQQQLPLHAELVGTSPRAIAVALRRALGDASATLQPSTDEPTLLSPDAIERHLETWKSIQWQVMPEVEASPALNVALDEVLTQEVAEGRRPALLRFWKWASQAVIIGRCQSASNEVDQEEAARRNISIVRRMTGGGAMFLQPHGAITYSLYIPEKLLQGLSLRQSYQLCDAWVIQCLNQLDVDAHYAPINDIACSMGKIGGAAQARRPGVVLHHTTIAYDMDPGEMVSVLRIGKEKLADKPGVASAAKRVSPLARQTGLSRVDIVTSLQKGFQQRFNAEVTQLNSIEKALAEDLVQTKYATPAWTNDLA